MIRNDVSLLENLYEHAALGVLVRFWCVVMRDEDSGKLSNWAPEEIAEKIGWFGPLPDGLIRALLDCGKTSVAPDAPGFIEKLPNGFAVYKWNEWQNDPAGTREKWKEQRKNRFAPPGAKKADAEAPKKEIGPKEECVRQILQAMSAAKIPGSPIQKREYAAAWIERPGVGGAKVLEVLMSPEARGQGVFWLDAQLGGRPASVNGPSQKSTIDKLKEWAKGGAPPATAGGKA